MDSRLARISVISMSEFDPCYMHADLIPLISFVSETFQGHP